MATEQEIEQLIQNVRSISDRMDLVDTVLKNNKLGRDTVLAFRCGESGLLYPADYVKEWGRLYGIGLGPHPVSESLQSDYYTDPPPITNDTRSFDQIMHPLYVSCAQMDSILVPAEEFEADKAILDLDDKGYFRRAPVLRAKQIANAKGKLRNMAVAWERAGKRN